jgi:hypothetical protein
MADSDNAERVDYRRFAGTAVFPRNPADLTNAGVCPACLSILSGPRCGTCRLDLTHPAAAELARVSGETADLFDRRLELIGRIRYDDQVAREATRAAVAAAAAPVPGAAPAGTASVRVPLGRAAPLAPAPERVDAAASRVTDDSAPRRSSVQVILLIVGISLLSVAAIFFLVYAFINYGILGRSAIIATVTLAAVAIASMLHRRSLTATAEGIAALAVVLVYLDAFAIRANDFFSLGGADAALYWGGALAVTAALFLVWHRLSGLRTPRIIGFAAIVPAVGLIVAGAATAADGGTRAYLAFVAAALAGGAHHFASRPATAGRSALAGRAERTIVRALTGIALAGGFISAALTGGGMHGAAGTAEAAWSSVPAYLGVAALAAVHSWLVGRDPAAASTPTGPLFAGLGGVAATVAVGAAAVRLGAPDVMVFAPPIAAVLVALALEFGWRRLATRDASAPAVRSLRTATLAATVVFGATLLAPGIAALTSTAAVVTRAALSSWDLAADAVLVPAGRNVTLSVLALATVVALSAAGWALGGALRRRVAPVAWFSVAVLLVSAPLLATLAGVVGGWLVLAVAALGALLVLDRGGRGARLLAPLMVLCGASGALGYLAGWGGLSTWWIASLVILAVLLASRLLPASPLGRATSLGTAAVVFLIAAGAAARQLALPSAPGAEVGFDNVARAAGLAAIALIAASALSSPLRLSTLDRRVLFGIGTVTAGASFATATGSVVALPAAARMSLLLPEFGTSLAASAALLAVLLLWVTRPAPAASRVERTIASIGLAPTLALLLDGFVRVLDLPGFTRSVAPVSAALLAAVGVLVVTARRPDRAGARWPRELGILLLGVSAVTGAVARHDAATWLVLLLGAITTLVLAFSADGLFSSAAPRRYLGWLALALATASLWWRLGDSRVTAVEPYVLPLAGTLLLVAALLWRATPSATGSARDRVAPLVTLMALLVGIVPLAVAGATGDPARPLIVGAIAATLGIAGSLVVASGPARPFRDAAALAGVLGVVLVAAGRVIGLLVESDSPDPRLDAWLFGGAIALGVCAAGQARLRPGASVGGRNAGEALGVVALGLMLLELPALGAGDLAPARALGTTLLFCAVHVVSFAVDRSPLTRWLGWVAIAFAGVTVGAALAAGVFDQVELGTVPLAVALLSSGALTLGRTPTARTWPWLAPGVGVLLVPSLLATVVDPAPWRLVGLGVVGAGIIVASAILRLQAPFLISVVVVIIHALATFAPQIRTIYEAVEWWLWFVPVGIIVVVFAARFERSVLAVRSVAMRIRALR